MSPVRGPQPGAVHDDYEIVTTESFHDRRPRTLKHNDTFAVFDHSGDMINGAGSSEGLYHRDTRHLSHYYLTINGNIRPILLSSSLRDDNSVLTIDVTNPDIAGENGDTLQNDLLHIRRMRFISGSRLYDRITLTNYRDVPATVSLELHFASDFADLFEVRGATRIRRGERLAPEVEGDSVLLAYTGLDELTRSTRLSFSPAPTVLARNLATFRVELQPGANTVVLVEIDCGKPDAEDCDLPLRQRLVRSYRDAREDLRKSSGRATSLDSPNEVFNQSMRRCVADTYMLVTETEYGPYPYAGIPWYSTVFGRDALITAMELLWLDPAIAKGVLCYLAANQADRFDAASDAEPGKILHEVRYGEMAILGEVPFRHYYGSIDSTPLFVMLAGRYLERTNDVETLDELWPNIARALEWIDEFGDRDKDGYVEYGRYTEQGLLNQGWKDSHDSIFHADGTIAKGPIALCEVQGYTYGAWHAAAAILERRGEADEAALFRGRAEALKQNFDRDFFDEELGTYVLALDGEKRPCRVRSSNAGQVLFAGLALPERAGRVAHSLMAAGSFSGWGIRTIDAGEARYNPMSYHNGSIWPHDNALIGAGFSQYGYRAETSRIFEGLFAASTYVDLRRLPELFCGFVKRPANGPTFYPVSCIPQAWSAAAQLSLVQSCLGLSIDAEARRIQFDQPMLPPFVDELKLGKLAIGDEWVDLRLQRSGTKVLVEVLDRKGDLKVVTSI
ncbi:MAG: amylo-alpha-1,6-glucosidase [Candidatus Andeanibacterium colombiense]|uniref:Amylo-alpha-1,6-glucosidase n=1 Tax=Candidatus Andeanibacterium colombiense TaxID=3121345 RepID=A0AAJ5XAT3_9SPHN|nr:MAG: amylo-alpha-1,6-glucosidase [Sphingomonadaceae bacterium]